MKITGIIAEYNPFHNGHAYQIAKIKEETARDFAGFYQLYTKYGEDYEIPSILSGNLSRENLALKEKMAADGAF